MKYSIAALILFVAMPLMAQNKPTTPTPAKPVPITAPVATPPVPPVDPNQPVITELQETKFELATTKLDEIFQLANAQAGPWQAKRQAVINEILAANPSFMWHESQGQGDFARFVKIPPPAPKAPEVAKPEEKK